MASELWAAAGAHATAQADSILLASSLRRGARRREAHRVCRMLLTAGSTCSLGVARCASAKPLGRECYAMPDRAQDSFTCRLQPSLQNPRNRATSLSYPCRQHALPSRNKLRSNQAHSADRTIEPFCLNASWPRHNSCTACQSLSDIVPLLHGRTAAPQFAARLSVGQDKIGLGGGRQQVGRCRPEMLCHHN